MKFVLNHIVIIAVFVLVLGALILLQFMPKKYTGKGLWPNYMIKQMSVEGRDMNLIIADTPERWSQGLMYVEKPTPGFDGMVFIFDTHSEKLFWNENTYTDLKLYWMNNGKVIGTSDLPSIKNSKEIVQVVSPGPVDMVVEEIK